MRVVEQWDRIERELPDGWAGARLRLTLAERGQADRAAALLGPLGPGRRKTELLFATAREGPAIRPDNMRRLLVGLGAERIEGTLELLAVDAPTEHAQEAGHASLAASWQALVATLPDDWSDLYCELQLESTDQLERAALLLAPLNPARHGGTVALRFRAARLQGYGASAEMTRRCLERLDADGIPGRVEILRSLSDTRPVDTQGPVWRVGGRSV